MVGLVEPRPEVWEKIRLAVGLSAAQSLSSDSNRLKIEVGKFLNTVRAA
eukprot:gene8605-11663_t